MTQSNEQLVNGKRFEMGCLSIKKNYSRLLGKRLGHQFKGDFRILPLEEAKDYKRKLLGFILKGGK